jgi:DNA-binding Xre family transcriptional regulator
MSSYLELRLSTQFLLDLLLASWNCHVPAEERLSRAPFACKKIFSRKQLRKSRQAPFVIHLYFPTLARISGTCAVLRIPACLDLRIPAHVLYSLPMSERKVVGKAIKVIRKAKGINQDTLAIAAGISPSHLQRIETGERQPTQDALNLICINLGINSEDITYEVETLILVADPAHAKLISSRNRVLVAA